MRVEHPRAGDGPGVPPANVDVDGDTVPVDDEGVFEVPEEASSAWLERFADAYDTTADDLTVDDEDVEGDTNEDASTESSLDAAGKAIAEGDATAFVDRTPVSDVADDIREGLVDDVLDPIEEAEQEARDRKTVYDAIEERRDTLDEEA